MTIPEKAVEWAVKIARDDSHGYDQSSRWGPDYDCSSLVISAYKNAGVPLTCTYTGNMRSNMLDNGFVIPVNVNLATGAGLQPGDVLLNVQSHTALYIGDGQIVQASINEEGKTTGGQTGDQTGREIQVRSYYNFPWDFALRYVRKEEPEPDPEITGNVYVVRDGDSLWKIAQECLGDPWRYPEILKANGMTTDRIFPGQVLVIPGEKKTVSITAEVSPETYKFLKALADGNGLTIGQALDKAVEEWI